MDRVAHLVSDLRRLDRQLAKMLDDPERLRASWFTDPELASLRPSLDDIQLR